MMRKSRKTANKKPHGHEEEMKTSVAKRNIKTKNAESTQRASASNVKRKEPTGLTSRFLWRHLENRGIIRRNVLHYMNQHRDDEEDTADLQPETAVPVADHQPKTDKNTTLHSAGDIRVTFINDYCKRGVRVVMREFTQVRSYLPKNLKVEHFNRNSNRNRYADVMCHDETRVILRNRAPDDNYIHASYIRINPKAQTYIATQGPMTETTIDFWQMVVQEKAAVVVMLCNFHEKGEEKCCNYYPLVKGETNTFGKFKVCNSQSGQTGIDTITWSELQVDAGDEKASVYHLLWTDWTDHSAPSDALPVIQLLKLAKSKANGGPIVVHCSAGIGRTGTFIAIDFVNEKLRHSSSVTMQDLIKELRGQRLHAIQSAPQYIFIHVALIEMAISENLIERTPLYRSFQANYNTYLMKLRKKNSARRAIDVPTPVNNPALPNKN
ncbi:hypothetical protein M3Y94_01216300 [Aphelenchoides besseyi]|nr:hypothetical protein M3Y94_01216300 [Aphelenchoides besseyi]